MILVWDARGTPKVRVVMPSRFLWLGKHSHCPLLTNHYHHNHNLIGCKAQKSITYDHTSKKTRDPVRSPIDKLERAGSVLRWVTTGESPVLYVFFFFFFALRIKRLQMKTGISWRVGQPL